MAETLQILCAHCHVPLYWYKGDFTGRPRSVDFLPIQPSIPRPRSGERARCFKCLKPFYLLRTNGAIIVYTNKGYKPSAPEGRRSPTLYKPVEYGPQGATEYLPPKGRR